MVFNVWIIRLALVALATLSAPFPAHALTANVAIRAIDHQPQPMVVTCPTSAPNAPIFENCSNKKQKGLEDAIAVAMDVHAATLKYLDSLEGKPVSHPAWKRFTRWFGTPTDHRYQLVRKMFSILPKRPLTTLRYVCDEVKSCGSFMQSFGIAAKTVSFWREEHISICQAFWLKQYTPKQRALTLIHEWTHLHWGKEGGFSTIDAKYGSLRCLKLAKDNPNLATINADNYAFFAMDLKCVGIICNIA